MMQSENEVDMAIESWKKRIMDGWAESTILGNVKVYDGYDAAVKLITYYERVIAIRTDKGDSE